MGVSSTQNREVLAGDGISTSFTFPYYFFRQADLLVYIQDTLTGAISGPYILNTDYTIVGAQNYQGLYPNGGDVNFSTIVPAATDLVIITRDPIQQQNFSIAQTGTISSTATVQQFDYLTLLIQRQQDENSRAIRLPDGFGETFDLELPADIALQPNTLISVNPTGDGFILVPAAGGGGGGTVTSVGLSMPAMFNVANSPVTAAGTLTVSLANQAANLVFAGPAAGPAAAPTFRALVPADLPAAGPLNVINGGDANYNFGATDAYVRSGTPLTVDRTWTLQPAITVGQQVTVKNLASQDFNVVLAGNGGDTVDGAASVLLSPGVAVTLVVGAVGRWDII